MGMVAHRKGVLSCRSWKHSASPMLLPRLWSLDPTSPIHLILLPSKLGSCLCQPHQALYLQALSTSPRPEQRAGNTSPAAASAAQDWLCGHLCPESFSLSIPLIYCFCLGFPVFGGWSPSLIYSQDTRRPLASPSLYLRPPPIATPALTSLGFTTLGHCETAQGNCGPCTYPSLFSLTCNWAK